MLVGYKVYKVIKLMSKLIDIQNWVSLNLRTIIFSSQQSQ